MFDNASSYNQPLASWNVSKVVSNYDNFATNSPLCSHTLLPKAFININVCDNIIKDSNIHTIIGYYFGTRKKQMIQIYGPISNWNVSRVTNMDNLFSGMSSFNDPLASWDVSKVKSMSSMFDNTTSYNQPLASWNVSSVTNMSYMFNKASSYNQSLASWNVSQVTNNDNFATNSPLCSHTLLPKAFININVCDNIIKDSNIHTIIGYYFGTRKKQMIQIYGPISNWNVSRVTNMDNLFSGMSSFNDPLASWDVSKVKSMSSMFDNTTSYNQPLASWNVSSVTNYDNFATNSPLCSPTLLPKAFININVCDNIIIDSNIKGIISNYFGSGKAQVIRNIGPISNWNVSRVTNMDNLFNGMSTFNDPLASWNVSQVTNMSYMFDNASSYNQPLASWNVSKVKSMSSMFYNASSYNQPLASWNVSQVTNMSSMFEYVKSYNQSLASWNVSQVTNMSSMFYGANSYNQPLVSWNVSQVTNMSYMFAFASSYNQPLASWNVSQVTNMSGFAYDSPLCSPTLLPKAFIKSSDC